MSDDFREVESVDAEIVEEGKVPFTMPDMPEAPVAPEAPKPEFSERDMAGSAEHTSAGAGKSEGPEKAAGTVYENSAYVEKPSQVCGIISIICGALSFICCCTGWFSIILGIAAIVLGIISIRKEPTAKTLAVIGIVCGSIGLLIGIVAALFVGVLKLLSDAFTSYGFDTTIIDGLSNFGDL